MKTAHSKKGLDGFRSDFRRSLAARFIAWCETPSEDRQWGSPFSRKQWDCVGVRDWRRKDDSIYRTKGYILGKMAA